MCGIVGKLAFSQEIIPETLIRKMCGTLERRGPDAEGIYCAPHIGLGQRRLSIVDLDSRANPPLCNEDRSLWVVLNGEIYNFRELNETLRSHGHVFSTETDTETLLHLYEEHGTGMLGYLQGMFAFAIWDTRRQRLFAARDRFGKKPFIYTKTPSCVVFGSAIRAVLADPSVPRKPDFHAIDAYLSLQYVPSPLTAFKGISKLPPAHYLLCDSSGNFAVERYWAPPYPKKSTAAPAAIKEELVDLLKDSVRVRMLADVPVGAFLSGGIDSGLVVAMMAQASTQPVKTFSIGFEEEDRNELPYARAVSRRYGTEHSEFIVKADMAALIPELVREYNEPFADSSSIPTYYVSKLARSEVTVALSGDAPENLQKCFNILNAIAERYQEPVIVSTHPRTRKRMDALGLVAHKLVEFHKPFGFFDYIKLQTQARAVLSDSGTITEESSILNFPALNLREVHERPEGFEEASVIFVGLSIDRVMQGLGILETQPRGNERGLRMVTDWLQQTFAPDFAQRR
jgi:asparagine synthase (glutamine-hydrolysing)